MSRFTVDSVVKWREFIVMNQMKTRRPAPLAQLALLVIGALLSHDSFASRATVNVLGTGDAGQILSGGSFFYDDQNNIFYNPSYINDFRNFGIIEKSNFPGTTAQGGFFTSFMLFNIGAYFNRGDAVLASFPNRTQMRPIEITLGSELGGFKWGLTYQRGGFNGTAPSLTVGGTNVTSDGDDNTLRVGAQIAGFEPFVSWEIKSSDTIGGTTTEQKGVTFGTRYRFGEWTPYAAYRYDTSNSSTSRSAYVLGLGRSARLAEGVKLHYALAAVRNVSTNTTIIPLDFAAEADATVWLTFRAGLGCRLLDRTGGTSNTDNTTGRIGSTIHLSKSADFDWALGRNSSGSETSNALDAQVFDVLGIFTAASLTYRW